MKIAGIIVGGLWTYYGLVKGRLYRSRLEAALSGKTFRKDDKDYLVARVVVKNVGSSNTKINDEDSGLRVFSCEIHSEVEPPDEVQWVRLGTFSLFEHRGWLDTGESMQLEKLIVLPSRQIAVKLQAVIVGSGMQWDVETIVNIQTQDQPKVAVG